MSPELCWTDECSGNNPWHSSLGGTSDGCSQSFMVEPGLLNALVLKTGSWLYLYGTELDEEAESDEARQCLFCLLH